MIEPELVRLFATGWCRTRRLPDPIDEGRALRIEVGSSDELCRFVFPHPPAGIVDVAAQVAAPLILLKAPLAEEAMRALLPGHWHVERTGTMMTQSLIPSAQPSLSRGYDLVLSEADGVIAAQITSSDKTPVARGLLTVIDQWALHDRIRVEDAHQRRGLGRAVMVALGVHAAGQGARWGILAATDMGRALYQTMGWQARAPWTTAQIKR